MEFFVLGYVAVLPMSKQFQVTILYIFVLSFIFASIAATLDLALQNLSLYVQGIDKTL